ncbi:hypothetical protein HDU80_002830, partial [Chytriomyces hyalinus]
PAETAHTVTESSRVEATVAQPVQQVVTTAAVVPTEVKKMVSFPEPVAAPQPRQYSNMYKTHIQESETVISCCEDELKARQLDHHTFPRSELLAWMEEIRSTTAMFIQVGGDVLGKEWKDQGFAEDAQAPHVLLVERAKKISADLEAFKLKL